MTETAKDGRVARGIRTREAVIDTLFELYAEGNLTPTIEQIADRIGRTTRAIYQHFQDKEALAAAMAKRQLELHRELFEAHPISGGRTKRIDGIVAHRAELFETVAPARRSALVRMHASPELQAQQTYFAEHFRRQLVRTFEPELTALSSKAMTRNGTGQQAAGELLELLDLHTSWDTWERLRTWQSLPVERSRQLVTRLVTQALRR
ncbi:MAG: TetR/AcrR family transcriptional regulator [Actinomycetia bacterium]|nr:TetR/AcrR family transcriptional regulator [Actinomycetes bacterium]MCP4960405.1 TetR/AcrR family transcriptional regulator [Actinomycetes bacterium]